MRLRKKNRSRHSKARLSSIKILQNELLKVKEEAKRQNEDIIRRDGEVDGRIEKAVHANYVGVFGNPKAGDSKLNDEQKKLREIIKRETEYIQEFVQEYINEAGMNCITVLKSLKRGPTEKMDSVDWVGRNVEFLSPPIFLKFIEQCKESLSKGQEDYNYKCLYVNAHTSEVYFNLRKLIVDALDPRKNAELKRYLTQYLKCLEILLLNPYNLEKAIESRIVPHLLSLASEEFNEDEEQSLAVESCLCIILPAQKQIQEALQNPPFVRFLANCLKKKTIDLNLLGPRLRMLGLAFKQPSYIEGLFAVNKSLVSETIKLVKLTMKEGLFVAENLQVRTCDTGHLQLQPQHAPARVRRLRRVRRVLH